MPLTADTLERIATGLGSHQAARELASMLQGIVPGLKLSCGTYGVNGSFTAPSGLNNVAYAVASLMSDPDITKAVLVTASPSGANVVLKTWKPTSSSDGTLIAGTTSMLVTMIAIGT